jgi:hypothetical protein
MRKSRRSAHRNYSRVLEVPNQSEANIALAKADDLVLVVRGIPRTLRMRCPCNCGELLTIPIDPSLDLSWNLIATIGGISLSPSVWRESGCKSHFILWNNSVYMCSQRMAHSNMDRQGEFRKMLEDLFDGNVEG